MDVDVNANDFCTENVNCERRILYYILCVVDNSRSKSALVHAEE